MDYVAPSQFREALEHLYDPWAIPLAGGTDLLIKLRSSHVEEPAKKDKKLLLVDLKRIKELHFVEDNGEFLRIGSLTTLAEIASNPMIARFAPSLSLAARSMGSLQIRNRGTIGGNIVNASPCADLVPPLLIHDSVLSVEGLKGGREIPLNEFISGPFRTKLLHGEIVTGIVLAKLEEGGETFYKLGRRDAMNKARMNFASYLSLDQKGRIREARFSSGALTPFPMRFTEAEKLLLGERPTEPLFEKAASLVREKISEITGVRWSTPYKAPVSENLTLLVLREASMRAREKR